MKQRQKTKTRLIVAASDHDADMLYATRFFAPDPFIFLEQNGKRTLVLSDLEIDRGRKQARGGRDFALQQVRKGGAGHERQGPGLREGARAFSHAKETSAPRVVPANFPLGYARELESKKIRLQPTNGPLLAGTRSENRGGTAPDAARHSTLPKPGWRAGWKCCKRSKPGKGQKLEWSGAVLTSEILRAEIDTAVLRAGGLPANTIVAGGDQACDPHERGHGPLKANRLIILDIFPRSAASGYYGDMTRTVVRGRASDEQRRLWETVNEGQALALKKMKPGVDGLKLHKEVKQFFTDRGYPTEVRDGRQIGFFHGTGHGLGLEIHEFPRFQKTVFKPGQVLTVEPGLYYPGLGGARTEDVVAMTKSGIRMLSRFEKRLEI